MTFMLKFNTKICLLILIVLTISQLNFVNAQDSIPDWVKNTAGWWASDAISETEFVNSIEFLINEGIIDVSASSNSKSEEGVPNWVKNTAGWWASDAISETEFVNAIKYLIKINIITINENNIISFEYLSENILEKKSSYVINNEGLRGIEINTKKIDDYRIIVVGGSTIFGTGVEEDETIPYYLENKFKLTNLDKDVDVINAGIPSAWSETEKNLIYQKLLSFNPDLIIVYDGWNDLDRYVGSQNFGANPILWETRWSETCRDFNQKEIEMMIILQPFVGTGSRVITDQEFMEYFPREEIHDKYIEKYQKFGNKINKLNDECTKAIDFRDVFDGVYEPLYWDIVHLGSKGNEIVAEEIFKHTLQVVKKTNNKIENKDWNDSSSEDKDVIKITEKNLRGADLKFMDLSNHDFTNADLTNADLRFTVIENTSFEGAKLTNVEFSRSQMENVNFSNTDLTNAKFFGSKMDYVKFDNADLANSDLRAIKANYITLENSNLDNADLSKSIIFESDFSTANLTNVKLTSAKLIKDNFTNSDFSTVIIKGDSFNKTVFAGSNLSNVNFDKVDLKNVNFSAYMFNDKLISGADLSSVDFHSNSSIENAVLSEISFLDYNDETLADEFYIILDRYYLEKDIDPTVEKMTDCMLEFSGQWEYECIINSVNTIKKMEKFSYDITDVRNKSVNLQNSNLSGLDLSGFNISKFYWDFFQYYYQSVPERNNNLIGIDLRDADLSNTNFENADLSYSNMQGADLTGANLTNTNLHNANLEGAKLDQAILKCNNNSVCK